jgi:voltage-gated sodium channel
MRAFLKTIVGDRIVMGVILLNTLALFLHEMAERGTAVRAMWFWIDYACVVFFIAEVLIKVRLGGWRRYWASGWNRFDLSVVVASLPAVLSPVAALQGFAFVLVLRLGRLFRLFRILRFIPNLDHVVLGVRRALAASVGVFLALLLIDFILAMGATLLFRDVDPAHFGNPLRASYSIFQVFTLEGWYEYPEHIGQIAQSNPTTTDPGLVIIGARVFFVVAVIIGGILGLSLANAVFVDQMMMDNTYPLEAKVDQLAEELRKVREELTRISVSDHDRDGGA